MGRVFYFFGALFHDNGWMISKQIFWERAAFFVAVGFFGLAHAAGADTSRDEEIAERFASADTNHDGQLTLAEAEAGMPRVAANFTKIDADKSGTVTLAEIEAMANR